MADTQHGAVEGSPGIVFLLQASMSSLPSRKEHETCDWVFRVKLFCSSRVSEVMGAGATQLISGDQQIKTN